MYEIYESGKMIGAYSRVEPKGVTKELNVITKAMPQLEEVREKL